MTGGTTITTDVSVLGASDGVSFSTSEGCWPYRNAKQPNTVWFSSRSSLRGSRETRAGNTCGCGAGKVNHGFLNRNIFYCKVTKHDLGNTRG